MDLVRRLGCEQPAGLTGRTVWIPFEAESAMLYEVELKFPIADASGVRAGIDELGAKRQRTVNQSDRYFNHPQRDFGESDEALRIRTTGDNNCITYKGPLVDKRTKTRREIEIPFESGSDRAAEFGDVLGELGFRETATVTKSREYYTLRWDERDVEVTFDEVDGLGSFVELEASADDASREAVTESILRLAQRLGLENSQRKSYLCLLLEKQDSQPSSGGR